jgi:Leucine-rich repeat (LRR) protein
MIRNGTVIYETFGSVKCLDPKAFASSYYNGITNIELRSNSISALHSRSFQHTHLATSLQRISFYNNKISILSNGIFDGLNALKSVYLRLNSLSSIHFPVFRNLPKLEEIVISKNKLSSVNGNIWSGIVNLIFIFFVYIHVDTF